MVVPWRSTAATKTSSTEPHEVRANIYALFPCLNATIRFASCGFTCWGLWHCGIEINGREWSYGGHHGKHSGVAAGQPRSAVTGAKFTVSVPLGQTPLDPIEVRMTLAEVAVKWRGCDYHLLTQNCNHFASELAHRLGVDAALVPPWINAITKSRFVSRLLPVAERVGQLLHIEPVLVVEPLAPTAAGDGEEDRTEQPASMYSVLLETAQLQKERGNSLFSAGRYAAAVQPYRKASAYLDNAAALHAGQWANSADALRISLWSNLAACLLKLGSGAGGSGGGGGGGGGGRGSCGGGGGGHQPTDNQWGDGQEAGWNAESGTDNQAGRLSDEQRAWLQECVALCTRALSHQPAPTQVQQPKALYRRAVARRLLGELESARIDLVAAAVAEPKSREIRDELDVVKELEISQRQHEKEFARRALGGGGDAAPSSELRSVEVEEVAMRHMCLGDGGEHAHSRF